VILALTLAASAVANESELKAARENKAWDLIKGAVADHPTSQILEYLKRFVAAYPKGRHLCDAQYAAAETYYQMRRYKEAFPFYQYIIEHEDSAHLQDAWLRLGEIHYNAGDIAKARKAWRRLDKSFGKSLLSAEALFGMALCALHEKDYREVDKILTKLGNKYPSYKDLAKVRELRGIMQFNKRDFPGAIGVLTGIETPVAAFYRGMSYFYQKQYQDAAESFHSLGKMPENDYAEIGGFLKAECFRMVRNDALSAEAYQAFLNDHPESRLRPYATMHLARALNELGQGLEAEVLLRRLRQDAKANDVRAEALHLEVEIAARMGEYRRAKELLQRELPSADAKHPDQYAHTYVLLGYYLLKVGKLQEAAEAMMDLVRKSPGHSVGAVAYVLAGQSAYHHENWHAAISAFETALLKYEYGALSDMAMAMMLASYYNAGNYQELVTHAKRVMGVTSSAYSAQEVQWRSQSHFLIAEAYYRLKQFTEASRFYELAMREPSLASQAQLYLAWSRYHEGQYGESLKLAREVLRRPGMTDMFRASAHFLMASSYFNEKNYDASIESFHSFRKNFAKDVHVPETWLHEGWAHRQKGHHGDALVAWGRLVSLFPEHPLAQKAQIQIGRLYFQARKYNETVKMANEFLTRWPSSPSAVEAQWLLAQSYYNARQDDAAIKAFTDFLLRFPGDDRRDGAVNALMQTRFRRASQSKDLRLLADFVKSYPKSSLAAEAQYQLGQAAYESQNWGGSIQAFRKLMLDYPGTSQAPLALIAVAHAQERLKKYDAAVNEYKSVMELFPLTPLALDAAMRSGALYFNMGKYQDAANSFRYVVEREAPKEVQSNALFNIGVAFKKARSYSESIEAFERFVNTYANDVRSIDALLEVAALYRVMEQTGQSIATYERILKREDIIAPVRMTVCNQIGEVLKSMGDKDKAIEAYAQLIALTPADQDARLVGLAQLAALYEEKELWDKALEVYGHIQSSGGQADWVRSAAKRAKEINGFLESQKAGEAAASASGAVENGAAGEGAKP